MGAGVAVAVGFIKAGGVNEIAAAVFEKQPGDVLVSGKMSGFENGGDHGVAPVAKCIRGETMQPLSQSGMVDRMTGRVGAARSRMSGAKNDYHMAMLGLSGLHLIPAWSAGLSALPPGLGSAYSSLTAAATDCRGFAAPAGATNHQNPAYLIRRKS